MSGAKQNQLRVLGVIPARLASTRLPEKPLKRIAGKTLIEWVYGQAKQVNRLTELVVATDSDQIATEVTRFGGQVVMTAPELSTGSERVHAAAQLLAKKNGMPDIVLNIQGDMPFIPPQAIDRAVDFLVRNRSRFDMVTVGTPIRSEEIYLRPSVVKVAVSEEGRGLYFSRAPIPWARDGNTGPIFGIKHFGLYVFTPTALEAYNSADQSALETVEKLEQLRLLERGYRVGVLVEDDPALTQSIEIDTPEDLAQAERLANERRGKN